MDDFLTGLAFLRHGAHQPKDLCDPCPLVPKKRGEFVTGDQFPDFQSPMAFVAGARGAPILAVRWRLAEKEVQVVAQCRLIALGYEQEVASTVRDVGAERVLGVQG